MRIFLSYRRADTQEVARSMKTFLDQIPRIDEVFLDFDHIAVGEDFERRIQTALSRSSHCLVLIGRDWAGSGGANGPRIFDPEDFVRREATLALESDTHLIPVLVDGAEMPKPAELPEGLKRLSRINAFSLRTSHFQADMDSLLDAVFGKTHRGSRWRRAPMTGRGIAARLVGGLALAGAILVAGAIVSDVIGQATGTCGALTCRVQQVMGGGFGQARNIVVGGIALVLGLGAALPFLVRALRR